MALEYFDHVRNPVSVSDLERNLFISPVSLFSAFAIVLAGCRGDSEKQLTEALGISGNDLSMHQTLGASLNGITSASHYCKVVLANTMFLEKTFQIKSDFSNLAKTSYEAVPEQVYLHL